MTKRAAILSARHISQALGVLEDNRGRAIFLLSVRAGLRSVEIAGLKWARVDLDDGVISLNVTKGGKQRRVPIAKDLLAALVCLKAEARGPYVIGKAGAPSQATTSNAITLWLEYLYKRKLNWIGYSSHSGRRTFCTRAAKKIIEAGGSLADVQELMGHKELSTTQVYIETSEEAQRRVVDLL